MRACLLVLCLLAGFAQAQPITVGSKTFTESHVLAELVAQELEIAGFEVERKQGLGGTMVLWDGRTLQPRGTLHETTRGKPAMPLCAATLPSIRAGEGKEGKRAGERIDHACVAVGLGSSVVHLYDCDHIDKLGEHTVHRYGWWPVERPTTPSGPTLSTIISIFVPTFFPSRDALICCCSVISRSKRSSMTSSGTAP